MFVVCVYIRQMLETMLMISDRSYFFLLLAVSLSETTKMRLQLLGHVRTVLFPHHIPCPGIAHRDL